MTVKDIQSKVESVSKVTGHKTSHTFYFIWNALMDLLYISAILSVVSIAIYIAYTNGIEHPAIVWAGEKVDMIWLFLCGYFRIGG